MRRLTFFLLLTLLLATACRPQEPDTIGLLQGNYAFMPYQNRVQIIDVSDETRPEWVREVTLPGEVVKVVANGRFLYIAHQTALTSWDSIAGPPDAGLQIVDVSDPTLPQLRGFFRSHSIPTDLAVQDDVVYLADWEHVSVVDVSDVDNPTSDIQLPDGANSLTVANNLLVSSWGSCSFRTGYCGGGLRLFDLAVAKQPSAIGQMQVDTLPGYDVTVSDGYAFTTGNGVWVVDLYDLENLEVNGRYSLTQDLLFPSKIVVQGTIAYVQLYDELQLLDVSQPATPVLLGQYFTSNYITDLTVRGERAYLVGWSGLEIIDVADPASPRLVGSYLVANPVPGSPSPTATP
jgi:hypothetical protein